MMKFPTFLAFPTTEFSIELLATNLHKWTGDEFGTRGNLEEFRQVDKNCWQAKHDSYWSR